MNVAEVALYIFNPNAINFWFAFILQVSDLKSGKRYSISTLETQVIIAKTCALCMPQCI